METPDASSILVGKESKELTEREKLQDDFISNVTLHGFRYLFTATGTVRRCLWWICFLGALVFAVVLFKGVIDDYFEYKTYIVSNTFDKGDIKRLDFPTLTFCFNKPYIKSKLNKIKDDDLILLQKYASGSIEIESDEEKGEKNLKKNKDNIKDDISKKSKVKRGKDEISKKSKDKKSKVKKSKSKKIKVKKSKDEIIQDENDDKKSKDKVSKARKDTKSKDKKGKDKADKDEIDENEMSDDRISSDKISKILNELKKRKNITSYKQLLNTFTISINDQMKSKINKAFKKKICTINKDKKCQSRDFKMVLDKKKYPCLQYNFHAIGKPSKTQASYDISDGFEMFFDLNDAQAIGDEEKVPGITLYIHSRETPHYKPYPIDVPLQPGTQTNVIIEELKSEKLLPPPYGKCGVRRYGVIKGYPYSRPMCAYDCRLQKMVEQCGCIAFDLAEYARDVPVCSMKKMSKCYLKKKTAQEAFQQSKQCIKECVQECEQNNYPVRVMMMKLGIKKHVNAVTIMTGWESSKAKQYIEENIVGVRVAYKNIVKRQEVATPAVSIETLLGTIGGSIGLGLGFSALTLIEFLFFIFDFICTFCFGKRKQSPALVDANTIETTT